MASTLSSLVVLAIIIVCIPCTHAGYEDCEAYSDMSGQYHSKVKCYTGFCCGTCFNRYCCSDSFWRLTEKKQEDCDVHDFQPLAPMVVGIVVFIIIALIFILCCVCPCCCLYKSCRRPRPVVATTVVTSTHHSYPQQPQASQPYQGQYTPYQPVPVQPGYGAQPGPGYVAQPGPGYVAQPGPGYVAQPGAYQAAPFVPGPPPTYQEATGPYPVAPMPYSQAAFSPGQPSYPLQPPGPSPAHPPAHPQPPLQPNAPQMDFLSQPAFNPDYVSNKM
ncbi:unnamed protein product [Knipowitschia caucasica]